MAEETDRDQDAQGSDHSLFLNCLVNFIFILQPKFLKLSF
jgi:hypothetical protein